MPEAGPAMWVRPLLRLAIMLLAASWNAPAQADTVADADAAWAALRAGDHFKELSPMALPT